MHEAEICEYPIRLFHFYNNLICVYTTMLHKGASTQHHNQQVLATAHPIETNRQDRSYNKKLKSEAELIFNSEKKH